MKCKTKHPAMMIVVALMALFVVTTPALAHPTRAHDDQRVSGHARYGYVRHHARAPRAHVRHGRHGFVVPRTVHRAAHFDYAPYYHGRSWNRAHRHHHAVYYFPVRAGRGHVYRPHAYCAGSLVGVHRSHRGPRISIGVSF